VGLLYDAVALGMGAYTRTALSVRTLRPEAFRPEPGTIVVSTHRRETDVPLLCPSMYRAGRLWEKRRPRISFAARHDLFRRGFFAGFPQGLHPRLRRALWSIDIGGYLPGVQVHPIRSASSVTLGEVFDTVPEAGLDELLPAAVAAPFRARAARLGLPRPQRGADMLRGEYADLLWRSFTRETLDGPGLEEIWRRQGALATEDFRGLVELVRGGAILVVFPEGKPSAHGEIGPLRPGLGALVRRGRARWIQPVALAYDPLTRGRTRAYVSFLPAVAVPDEDVEETVLDLLRLATPLTCGQVVARRLVQGGASARELERELERELDAARAEGRNVDPALAEGGTRRRRIADALAAAGSHRADLAYLAREHASARGQSL